MPLIGTRTKILVSLWDMGIFLFRQQTFRRSAACTILRSHKRLKFLVTILFCLD